jgi:LysM repeat protein
MDEIIHHKARTLLQAAADRSLAPADRSGLDAHLTECRECNAYADRLARLEVELREAMHHKWDNYRPALKLLAIQNPSPAKLIWNNLFSQVHALRKVTILATLLLGYVVIVNLVGVREPIANDETPTALPTPNESSSIFVNSPTPFTQSALPDLTSLSCKTTIYVVQTNDTLESIAARFGITKEAIQQYNPGDNLLAANSEFTGMELKIPLCESTTARTASIPGNTLTITPIDGTILPEQIE